jgi:2,3-bisphosphoglycerate-dependent phosphoglycerate mutase
MTVKLIIARHGNTFEAGETPRRIGAKTDLPLVASGQAQAKKLGAWLKTNHMLPDVVYTSQLKRAIETAQISIAEAGINRAIYQSEAFNEIDHGVDENKPDPEIVKRIGADAFNKWEHESIMPEGWSPPTHVIEQHWADFAKHCVEVNANKTVLVVTSNGLARFVPTIAKNADDIAKGYNRKMATGALSILEYDNNIWTIKSWNIKP